MGDPQGVNAPPGVAPTLSRNLPANGEHHRTGFQHPRILMREAAKVCTDLDLPTLGGACLRPLVDRYVATGRPDVVLRTWVIAYADPTGETAVRRVMGGRS